MDRPNCVSTLVNSLLALYEAAPGGVPPVLVADDGTDEGAEVEEYVSEVNQRLGTEVVQYWRLPGDSGLSACRNFLVDRVQTPYFVLLDDDFVLELGATEVERLVQVMRAHPELDIVAGGLRTDEVAFYDYAGKIGVEGDAIRMREGDDGPVEGFPQCRKVDVTANFFAARTDRIRTVRWDDELKLGEHQDFFLRAKWAGLHVATCRDVVVYHKQVHADPQTKYKRMRMREFQFLRRMLAKHNLKRLIIYSGATYAHIP
eukprot:TRINITY_DN6319_c0_g1_i1.p2 TRINITY_DN6319_c0_g1~~TRINITY_DN6319_c0_g1_i1.p2  ORF type:complete len:297 (-),score=100.41 TRINITY_DN6319_c0_g1_i1:60-836(-)